MDKNFLTMAELFFSEVEGKEFDKKITNPKQIIAACKNQGTVYFVISAFKKLKQKSLIDIDPGFYLYLKEILLNRVLEQSERNEEFRKVSEKFKQNGISFCVLKGEGFSLTYSSPSLRTSGDTDILIDPKDENKAFEVLRSMGFDIEVRADMATHSKCYKKELGILELHVKVHYDYIKQIWFSGYDGFSEDYMYLKSENGYYFPVPSPTDGYIHLVLHLIEHFFDNGAGLRNVSDLFRYTLVYKDEIDFDKANMLFEKLNYKKFLDCVYGIGNMYFGYDFEIPDYDKEVSELILSDIEETGMFAKNVNPDEISGRFSSLKNKNAKSIISESRFKNTLKYISLGRENMKRRYPGKTLFSARITHIKNCAGKVLKRGDIARDMLFISKKESKAFKKKKEIIERLKMV